MTWSRANVSASGPKVSRIRSQKSCRRMKRSLSDRQGKMDTMSPSAALQHFHPATRAWFTAAFADPTTAQAGAWNAVAEGKNALVVAPTGSGKTLAAFLAALDRLAFGPPPADVR